jgi:hypothetical protein
MCSSKRQKYPSITLGFNKLQESCSLSRQGSKIATWEECYNPKAGVTLENGKRYGLRREVTHLIHNAAKKAVYHLGKIWRQKGQS